MDSYGTTKAATEDEGSQLPGGTMANSTNKFTCDDPKAGFNNLANAEREDQVTIGEMVKPNAVLAKKK